jgi:hypothetical protein
MTRCQRNNDVDSVAKVCNKTVSRIGLYCKGCREQMTTSGTWTEAHAQRQCDLRSLVNKNERVRLASLSAEEKETYLARKRSNVRNYVSRNQTYRQRMENMRLDPEKYEAFKKKRNETRRKRAREVKLERESKRAGAPSAFDDADGNDDDDDEKSAHVSGAIAIPDDNVGVVNDNGVVAREQERQDDSSGSNVEGIEFVSYDDEQEQSRMVFLWRM